MRAVVLVAYYIGLDNPLGQIGRIVQKMSLQTYSDGEVEFPGEQGADRQRGLSYDSSEAR